jgi:hypothetical protein
MTFMRPIWLSSLLINADLDDRNVADDILKVRGLAGAVCAARVWNRRDGFRWLLTVRLFTVRGLWMRLVAKLGKHGSISIAVLG